MFGIKLQLEKRKTKCSSVAGCPHNPTPEQACLFGSGSPLTCNAALPPHFGGAELPLCNASERRGILYPNSSTVTERRTQPTTCDCREICLLIISYCVIATTTLTTESLRREHEQAAAHQHVNALAHMFFLLSPWLLSPTTDSVTDASLCRTPN